MQFNLIRYELIPSIDGSYGAPDDGGTFNGLVGMLQRMVRKYISSGYS